MGSLKAVLGNKAFQLVAGFGGTIAVFSAGSVAGYLYAKNKLIAQYDEKLEEEIDRARDHFKKLNKREEFATPEAAAQALGVDLAASAETNHNKRKFDRAVAAMRSYNPGVDISDSTIQEAEAVLREESIVQNNVFNQGDPPVDFNYAEEVAARTADQPYIISKAEFDENDHHHEQVTLTYYAGDQTMADHSDQIVALVEETIGWENLRFGHRSNDNNVVHIRNEQYSLDMEIVRDERNYGEVVGGFVNRTGLG